MKKKISQNNIIDILSHIEDVIFNPDSCIILFNNIEGTGSYVHIHKNNNGDKNIELVVNHGEDELEFDVIQKIFIKKI